MALPVFPLGIVVGSTANPQHGVKSGGAYWLPGLSHLRSPKPKAEVLRSGPARQGWSGTSAWALQFSWHPISFPFRPARKVLKLEDQNQITGTWPMPNCDSSQTEGVSTSSQTGQLQANPPGFGPSRGELISPMSSVQLAQNECSFVKLCVLHKQRIMRVTSGVEIYKPQKELPKKPSSAPSFAACPVGSVFLSLL